MSKKIIVTGVTSGIGWSITQMLIENGFQVYGIGRREDRLKLLEKSLGDKRDRFCGFSIDLRDRNAISSFFENLPSIDGLINNAGLGHASSLIEGDPNHWQEMLDVNILALCICTQKSIQNMITHGNNGQIIHISSMSAHRVPQGSGMYSATKFAVRSLTEGLRKELREKQLPIRISSISPGFVETEFAELYHKSESIAKKIYSQYPVLQPKDIAEQVLFLLRLPEHVEVHDILMRPTLQPN